MLSTKHVNVGGSGPLPSPLGLAEGSGLPTTTTGQRFWVSYYTCTCSYWPKVLGFLL